MPYHGETFTGDGALLFAIAMKNRAQAFNTTHAKSKSKEDAVIFIHSVHVLAGSLWPEWVVSL